MALSRSLALALAFLFTYSSHATDLNALAQDRLWLRLLHLAAPDLRVISPNFYLSASSRQLQPLAELEANLKRATTSSDYQCQFPARDRWLRTHVGDVKFMPAHDCTELRQWRTFFAPQSISVVYPNHSLESSLSVFSHTFLKFNSAKLPIDSHLNVALGFAAEFDPRDSLAKLAAMGILGGYVGKFSTSNYYTEVNRYAESESRDIFEYELTLSHDEMAFMLDHLWEIKDAEFRYYFLNGNCSYYLLALLEIARPELDLTSHFHFVTIPSESLKVLVAQKNLIKVTRWVPGKQARRKIIQSSLNSNSLAFYESWRGHRPSAPLSQSLAAAHLSEEDQRHVLDLLADETRGQPQFAAIRSEALLLRSHLPLAETPPYPLPAETPDQSHDVQALALGAGYDQGGSGWAQLRYRFVLHSLLDPSTGYFRDTTLEVADLRLRYASTAQWTNSSFTLLNALALKPWLHDQHGITWQARSAVLNFVQAARWQNSGGVGLAAGLGPHRAYFMALVDSYVDGRELGSFGAFAGASSGFYLNLFEAFKIQANIDHLWPVHSHLEQDFWKGEVHASFSPSTKVSFQLSLIQSPNEQSGLFETMTYF